MSKKPVLLRFATSAERDIWVDAANAASGPWLPAIRKSDGADVTATHGLTAPAAGPRGDRHAIHDAARTLNIELVWKTWEKRVAGLGGLALEGKLVTVGGSRIKA